MDMFRIFVAQLMVLCSFLCNTVAQGSKAEECRVSTLCGECIRRNPDCAWCTDIDFDDKRCDLSATLLENGCSSVTYPQGQLQIVQNDSLTDAVNTLDGQAVQVAPQIVNVTLRAGKPERLRLNVRLANDFPLDLYYLTDLSYSFEDDLRNLRILATNLIKELERLTDDLQLGLGGFVDKTSFPYVVTERVNECMTEKDERADETCCSSCDAPFSFRNYLSLTNDTDKFAERVLDVSYSTNLDDPEGGLDTLVQVISCQKQIGWRDRARRIIVMATDDGFHMAGDGKMAGITKPNDGLCHLDEESNEYLTSTDSDYPSVGQINALLHEHNINVVFAVVDRVNVLYRELTDIISGGLVGVLGAASENVVGLVISAYRTITSKLEVVDTAPENIEIFYTSYCFGEEPVPGSSQCGNVQLGRTQSFDVEITATDCPLDGGKQIFTVRPFGFDETVTIVADIVCDCECEQNGVRNSTYCSNGNGTFTCGKCVCDEGRYGQDCECNSDDQSVDGEDFSKCIAPNTTLVCNGRGSCVCGDYCVCDTPMITNGVISGTYCECDNYSCARHRGELCGGPEHGECVCGSCQCTPSYEGDTCDCLRGTENCKTPNGLLCNGFGECKCGTCLCGADSPFQGPTCSDCPTCNNMCSFYQECVLCKVFDQGYFDKELCDMCSVTIEIVDAINENATSAVLCQYNDEGNCTIRYAYDMMTNVVYVQESKVCRNQDFDSGGRAQVDFKWLMIGIIAGIAVLGLLLIALVRLCFYIQDRIEYARFESELKFANKTGNENPLYKSTTTTFMNPKYGQ